MVYGHPEMLPRRWFPERLEGDLIDLRRHTDANLEAFRRWYRDPEVVRLTRYQDGPMAPEEIERFFSTRVLGSDSLAFAIHVRATDRLIGTCAFSQLDGDNGSALFHITIGETETWGHGYGTEATELMLEHAFERLGLHRVALAVFAFNERAIRSYRKVGFTVEGRARDAIWRDGRYWDELQMSVLEDDWREHRLRRRGGAGSADAGATEPRPVGVHAAGGGSPGPRPTGGASVAAARGARSGAA